MSKGIVLGAIGAAVLLVFGIVGGIWYQLLASGDSATVLIAAPARRVYASLTDRDSIPTWMPMMQTASSQQRTSAHRGSVVRGDTLRVQITGATTTPPHQVTWTVSEVSPERLLVSEMRMDSDPQVVAIRRDSIVAMGDSVLIVSTISSPMWDSVRTKVSGLSYYVSRMALSAGLRQQAGSDLRRLKDQIEGRRNSPGRR